MEGLKEILMKKKSEGKVLDPMKKKAKGGVLQNLIDEMVGMNGDKVKGLKKVTVASSSPEGLKEGLEKAEDIVEGVEPMSEEPGMEESEEMVESDGMDGEESEEEILAKIEELKSKLKSKQV